jgi:glycosyltransferase involved in cell wall biosynthesis
MRLLVLENETTSRRGGQELSLLDVCEGLAARGHSIVLAYVTSGDLLPRYERICERIIRVPTYAIDRTRTIASTAEWITALWAVRRSVPDVVYANQYQDSLLAAAVRRLLMIPFVCHLRLPPPDVFCRQFRVGMGQASRLIAISEQTRREWSARGFRADAIDLVYNGIDVARFNDSEDGLAARSRLNLPAASFIVTYAGRLHPAKGIEVLLEAFCLVARNHPCHLVIAGPSLPILDAAGQPRDYLAELRALASARGIGDAITWIASQGDMPRLLRASDLAVLPSLWSEPFGRIVIESMACGTPVVASRVGGIPEILTGEFAAGLFEAGDVAGLASRLTSFADWRTDNPALGERARAHVVSRFTLDRMLEGVERSLLATVERFGHRLPPVVESRIH